MYKKGSLFVLLNSRNFQMFMYLKLCKIRKGKLRYPNLKISQEKLIHETYSVLLRFALADVHRVIIRSTCPNQRL
jgi:hypothetical protein